MLTPPEETGPPVPELLTALIELSESDLHLMAGSPPFARINGDLRRLDGYAKLHPRALKEMVYAILPQRLRERFEQDLELDTSYSLPGVARFRVNVYQQRDSVGATFRLIPSTIRTVEELGLPPVVAELARAPRGFVVVTGPTGSGKSTTLAAMVDVIGQRPHRQGDQPLEPDDGLHRRLALALN